MCSIFTAVKVSNSKLFIQANLVKLIIQEIQNIKKYLRISKMTIAPYNTAKLIILEE